MQASSSDTTSTGTPSNAVMACGTKTEYAVSNTGANAKQALCKLVCQTSLWASQTQQACKEHMVRPCTHPCQPCGRSEPRPTDVSRKGTPSNAVQVGFPVFKGAALHRANC